LACDYYITHTHVFKYKYKNYIVVACISHFSNSVVHQPRHLCYFENWKGRNGNNMKKVFFAIWKSFRERNWTFVEKEKFISHSSDIKMQFAFEWGWILSLTTSFCKNQVTLIPKTVGQVILWEFRWFFHNKSFSRII
jgi:hypothetical protein